MAGEVLAITLARLKDAVDVGSGSVVCATNTVIDVLAVLGGVGASGVASFEAENISTHKAKNEASDCEDRKRTEFRTCATR